MKLCYLCHQQLTYEYHVKNSYNLICNNYDCPGQIEGISVIYHVRDQEVIHYYLPIYYNNQLYSITSSQLGTAPPKTLVEHYPHINTIKDYQVLADIPKFYPVKEPLLSRHAFQMIERFLKLKVYL